MTACIAQAALDYDAGALPEPMQGREVEENLWRAIRYGMDGRMIDFASGTELATAAALEALLEWTAPARESLAIDAEPSGPNGAQRVRAALAEGRAVEDVYRGVVEETGSSYAPECVSG